MVRAPVTKVARRRSGISVRTVTPCCSSRSAAGGSPAYYQQLGSRFRSREKRKAIPLLRHLLMTAPIRTSNVTAWFALEMAAVIGPLQQRLALPRSAERIARLTSAANLDSMAAKGPPAADLPLVLRAEPPARRTSGNTTGTSLGDRPGGSSLSPATR